MPTEDGLHELNIRIMLTGGMLYDYKRLTKQDRPVTVIAESYQRLPKAAKSQGHSNMESSGITAPCGLGLGLGFGLGLVFSAGRWSRSILSIQRCLGSGAFGDCRP